MHEMTAVFLTHFLLFYYRILSSVGMLFEKHGSKYVLGTSTVFANLSKGLRPSQSLLTPALSIYCLCWLGMYSPIFLWETSPLLGLVQRVQVSLLPTSPVPITPSTTSGGGTSPGSGQAEWSLLCPQGLSQSMAHNLSNAPGLC